MQTSLTVFAKGHSPSQANMAAHLGGYSPVQTGQPGLLIRVSFMFRLPDTTPSVQTEVMYRQEGDYFCRTSAGTMLRSGYSSRSFGSEATSLWF